MSPLRSASDALACERRHRSGTQWQHQGSCRRDASGRLRLRLAARLRCPMDRHPGPPWCPAMPELRPQFLASCRRTPGWGPARRRTPTDPQARDRAALERAVGRDLTRTRHRQNRQSSRSAPTLIFRKRATGTDRTDKTSSRPVLSVLSVPFRAVCDCSRSRCAVSQRPTICAPP